MALNSTSFNAARMVGPAVAGVLIAAIGPGWVFLLNAAVVRGRAGLAGLPAPGELHPRTGEPARSAGSLVEGFRYVWSRPDLSAMLAMLFLIGTFGLNFPIFISTMSVERLSTAAPASTAC